MKRFLLRLGLLLVAFGVVGALGVISGIVPIKASSGHWAITEWFLQFAMRRSIATHSLGIKAPPLDDPALVLKGATHYEIGCRSCHGSPGMTMPRIPQAMTPHPPYLPPRIAKLSAQELFYVVKHGVKFTGMPAWPAAHRDDEIWAVVAFLQKLPELDKDAYQRLAGEPAATAPIETLEAVDATPRAVFQSCARCHGFDGLGRGSDAFPKLAGQRREYLENSLEAYARGERHSGIMEPIAAALSAEAIHDIAEYYSRLPPGRPRPAEREDAEISARGEQIFRHGIADLGVPSCIDCHGLAGRADYPFLTGQPAKYLALQLELFKKGQRGGTPFAHLMHPVAQRLDPDDIQAVAEYLQSLSAEAADSSP